MPASFPRQKSWKAPALSLGLRMRLRPQAALLALRLVHVKFGEQVGVRAEWRRPGKTMRRIAEPLLTLRAIRTAEACPAGCGQGCAATDSRSGARINPEPLHHGSKACGLPFDACNETLHHDFLHGQIPHACRCVPLRLSAHADLCGDYRLGGIGRRILEPDQIAAATRCLDLDQCAKAAASSPSWQQEDFSDARQRTNR